MSDNDVVDYWIERLGSVQMDRDCLRELLAAKNVEIAHLKARIVELEDTLIRMGVSSCLTGSSTYLQDHPVSEQDRLKSCPPTPSD